MQFFEPPTMIALAKTFTPRLLSTFRVWPTDSVRACIAATFRIATGRSLGRPASLTPRHGGQPI